MAASIIIGIVIFGYAGWTIYRHVQKSKEGKCAACELKKNCQSGCDLTSINPKEKQNLNLHS
ncbi:FeoB-associated Cys-rich membrane protein [Rummeliibacillus pycnus]|uniref:FeoB-associated Cys-rich membrane protein n=1 Tax=Rummeliibacillus pycnus TaxID=101070 RepID=UPI003D295C8B